MCPALGLFYWVSRCYWLQTFLWWCFSSSNGSELLSLFIGAALLMSGYGRFQSFQNRVVFELVAQKGTSLKSWIHNCEICRWALPPWWHMSLSCWKNCWETNSLTCRMCCLCFPKQRFFRSFVFHVRASNVFFWLTNGVIFRGQT